MVWVCAHTCTHGRVGVGVGVGAGVRIDGGERRMHGVGGMDGAIRSIGRPVQSLTPPLHTNQQQDDNTIPKPHRTPPRKPRPSIAWIPTWTGSCGARLGSMNSSSPRRGREAAVAAMGAPDAARARAVDSAIRPKVVASVAILTGVFSLAYQAGALVIDDDAGAV